MLALESIAGRRDFPVLLGPLFSAVTQRRARQNSEAQRICACEKVKLKSKFIITSSLNKESSDKIELTKLINVSCL